MNIELILSILSIPLGFVLLVWSADRFVDGASALANNLGVPPLIIGLTIVGFATSAPEMLISAFAAFDGNSGLAVGNAIGSNITNVALILGFTAMFYPIAINSSILKKELPILFGIMLLGSWMMWDQQLAFQEGVIFLAALFSLMGWIVWQGLNHPDDPMTQDAAKEIPTDMDTKTAIFWLVIGLAVLLISSKLLVWGAVNIAQAFGVSDLIIGLSIVALGTSLPELAATISCARKGESDIAVGNVIGSNMFNILGVLGIAAIISPTPLDSAVLQRDIPVMFGVLILLLVVSLAKDFKQPGLTKAGGLLLTSSYLAYQGYLTYISV